MKFIEQPKALKPIEGSVHIYLYDFFNIFGYQYAPENHIICPYYGKLFERRAIYFKDPDNEK